VNSILKVAVGVFLGIIAAFILIEMPGWIKQTQRNHAQQVMDDLTPEKLIARCGKPVKDETIEVSPGFLMRDIHYEGADFPKQGRYLCIVGFSKTGSGDWVLSGFSFGSATMPGAYVPEKDSQERIRMLPCLDRKQ
jgi:hypothetical protein